MAPTLRTPSVRRSGMRSVRAGGRVRTRGSRAQAKLATAVEREFLHLPWHLD